MPMVSRVILCGFLLFATRVYGQDNSLQQSVLEFDSKDAGLTETLLKFSHRHHLKIAIEYVDRASMEQPIDVSLKAITVRRALDSILSKGQGYSWTLQNGIVDITNKRASKRALHQLNIVIPVFRISEQTTVSLASLGLWWQLQVALDPSLKRKGFGGDILGDALLPVKPATLRNRTVREILAYIVLNSRAGGWIVSGPPECLGYTPYCGLWYVIEREPSDPSYQLLFQNIRKNL